MMAKKQSDQEGRRRRGDVGKAGVQEGGRRHKEAIPKDRWGGRGRGKDGRRQRTQRGRCMTQVGEGKLVLRQVQRRAFANKTDDGEGGRVQTDTAEG